MPKEIHSSIPVSIPEVRELFLARKKDAEEHDDELTYMQSVALDHANLISKISANVAQELIEDLMTNFGISDKGAITLANYLPETVDEARVLLDPESKTMETEILEQIVAKVQALPKLDKSKMKEEEDDLIEESFEEPDKEMPEDIPEDLL